MTAPDPRNVRPGVLLHVVYGEAGEYSGHSTWTVAAYLDRAKAEEHARMANETASACWADHNEHRYDADYSGRFIAELTLLDVSAPNLYDQPSYGVHIVGLHESAAGYHDGEAVLLDLAKSHGWLP